MQPYAINLQAVSKTYRNYDNSWTYLKQILTKREQSQQIHALHPLDLQIPHGQVVGLVGHNGAGKSTLLKIVTGTLIPDAGGICEVHGRVAALLELGGGFHPDMTGHENIYLSGTAMGLAIEQVDALYDSITAFADIGEFIQQPVKTYSSGMFVRLAFAVATCTEPDILIIDEALAVGDGAFARKSFDHIMQFRAEQKTILFCSHSLYQMEKICDRVIWLDHGQVKMQGSSTQVLSAYSQFIEQQLLDSSSPESKQQHSPENTEVAQLHSITAGKVYDQLDQQHLEFQQGQIDCYLKISFSYAASLPPPTIGVAIMRQDGLLISSMGTHHADGFSLPSSQYGDLTVLLHLKDLPLLRGDYQFDVYLGCEDAIHPYAQAIAAITFSVVQEQVLPGIVKMQHDWQLI